ncbi:MAG: hypothetical protein HY057_02535 [Rhodospirillales bacterium]|nr:hypothetical protein [Rhodospirillales bacterium]
MPVGEGRSRSSPNHCCRIIINPGRDTWPVQSPKLTVGPETSIDIEANAAGIGGITIGLSLKLTPDLIDVSPRGNCPAECGDESMRIGVSVVFEGEVTLRGQLLSLDGGAGAANFGTTEADLGPLFGKANLNGGNIPNDPPPPGPGGGPGIAGVGGVGLRRRLRKPAESFTYSVVCDSITRVMPGATPANTGGATTPGASSATPGGSTPASVPRDPQCPDPNLDAIVADSDMSQEFDRAWTRSRPNAPDVPHNRPGSQKREWGGWVILNARTGKYRFDSRGPGSRDELDLAPIPNVTYPECLMCWFHTHPNKRSEGYEPDASVTDVITYNRLRFPDGRRVPMLIRSHEGYHKYSHDF